MTSQLPNWVHYVNALGTLIIGAAVVWVAFRQWRTAQERVKLDLFDRRLAAYERLKDAVASINASGKVCQTDTDNFAEAMRDMRWLFDKDIEAFVEEIYDAILEKWSLHYTIKEARNNVSPQLQELLEKNSELFRIITNGIYTEMPNRMERFMRLGH